MIRKLREKINLFVAKKPQQAILIGITLFNVLFMGIAATILSILSHHLKGLKESGFWESVYYTITMILDAGCINNLIEDIGSAGAFAGILCLAVCILGMVSFTGAVIGYITNRISSFIESNTNGKNELLLSGHVVIVNWNDRGCDIIDGFRFAEEKVTVVVLVHENRDEIEEKIEKRLEAGNAKNIVCIVREGDTANTADLKAICIDKAKSVIILDDGETEEGCNIRTVRSLIQVSEISGADPGQIVLVEVNDSETNDTVHKIREFRKKENITCIPYKLLIGRLNAMIAITPELSGFFDRILSGRKARFVSAVISEKYRDENDFMEENLKNHSGAIPLSMMDTPGGKRGFFLVSKKSDLKAGKKKTETVTPALINRFEAFAPEKRNILVIGHNSSQKPMMEWFDTFFRRWQKAGISPVDVVIADDEESPETQGCYSDDHHIRFVSLKDEGNPEKEVMKVSGTKTTVLMLSDDQKKAEDKDGEVFTGLIRLQGTFAESAGDPAVDRKLFTVIAEVLNPKNEEIVKNYGADEIVNASRYISMIVSQVSLDPTLFEFYKTLFKSREDGGEKEDGKVFFLRSGDFFSKMPEKCSGDLLVKAVFEGSESGCKTVPIGVIRDGKEYVFFDRKTRMNDILLRPDDLLILFGRGLADNRETLEKV